MLERVAVYEPLKVSLVYIHSERSRTLADIHEGTLKYYSPARKHFDKDTSNHTE